MVRRHALTLFLAGTGLLCVYGAGCSSSAADDCYLNDNRRVIGR